MPPNASLIERSSRRYLVGTHNVYCAHLKLESPVSALTSALLLPGRDPPPLPKENVPITSDEVTPPLTTA
eukprot:2200612-Pyramimonas_sp.AAC.1